jgi:hypothetical protein
MAKTKPTLAAAGSTGGLIIRQVSGGVQIETFSALNSAATCGTLVGVGSVIDDADALRALITEMFKNFKSS